MVWGNEFIKSSMRWRVKAALQPRTEDSSHLALTRKSDETTSVFKGAALCPTHPQRVTAQIFPLSELEMSPRMAPLSPKAERVFSLGKPCYSVV